MPFYKQRTHQLSDAPRRPGRSGRPVIQLGLPVSLVGCWSFGWSVGSVHRLSRALTGRSAGWSVVRSVGHSDGLVGPPDRCVDSADRSAGRWVGRRHRADTEASVISPTTSHSNSEHCPRKKTSRLRRPAAGTPLLSGPTMLHGLESCGFSTSPSHLSIGGPQTSRGTVLPEASSGFVTFFSSSRDGHVANGQAYTDFREALREYTMHIRCVSMTLVGSTPDN